MNSEIWHNISTAFLILGIVFMLITLVLAVRFNLLAIIKSEIDLIKEKKNANDSDYLYNAVSDSRASNISGNAEKEKEKQKSSTYSLDSSTPVKAPSSAASTTIITPASMQSPAQNGGTIIISHSDTSQESEENAYDSENSFVITQNIIVIHGDPSAIRRR